MEYYKKMKAFFFESMKKGLNWKNALIALTGYFWGLTELSPKRDFFEIEVSYNQICREIYRGDY